jgi:hypothetical protein
MPARRAWFAIAQSRVRPGHRLIAAGRQPLRQPVCLRTIRRRQGNQTVNRIIWIVGLVVIILFIAGYFGLR